MSRVTSTARGAVVVAVWSSFLWGLARADAQTPATAPGDRDARLRHAEVCTGGADPSDPLPLIVAIHGLGDTPEGFARLFDGAPYRARVVLPQGNARYGRGFSWMPAAGTEAEVSRRARSSAERIGRLVAEVQSERPTTGLAVVTGLSQGGILAFVLAIERPDLFRGAVPIAGWLPRPLRPTQGPDSTGGPTIVALNGRRDRITPVSGARRTVARLRGLGWAARIVEYPGLGHGLSPQVLADLHDEIGALLGQDRTQSAPP